MHEQPELIKEVFARFGTAYYESEVLHRVLCNVCALATFEDPKSVLNAIIWRIVFGLRDNYLMFNRREILQLQYELTELTDFLRALIR